jgi:uncharacterized membrane protein
MKDIQKTMTYCVMHFVVAFIVAYAVSGNLAIAISISAIEPLVQTFCFFFHEKAWKRMDQKRLA